jgi:hypothetical protein
MLSNRRDHDLVFMHVGGKGRLPRALADLTEFGLQRAVIADLDVLDDAARVRELVEAAGGDFDAVAADLRLVMEQVASRSSAPSVKGLRSAVSEMLRRRDGSAITDGEADLIIRSVKPRSAWREVKRAGTRAFEGEASPALSRLLEALQRLGIFVVPVGELERWFTDISVSKQQYVAEVLQSGRYRTPTVDLANFMEALISYFGLDDAGAA